MSQNPFSDYSDFDNDVDFDNNQSSASDKDAWYKGTKGPIDRASFAYFHRYDVNAVKEAIRQDAKLSKSAMDEIAKKAIAARAEELGKPQSELSAVDMLDRRTIKFKRFKAHYQEGLGFVISRLGMDGREGDAVWKQLSEPRVYYSTLLFFYPTDKKGNITKDREEFQKGWAVRPWRLSEPNYQECEKTNNSLKADNLTLAGRDVLLECKDQAYQKFTVTNGGPAVWLRSAEFTERVLTKSLEWYEKLLPFREMSTEALRQKLGGGTSSSSGGSMGSGGGGGGALPAGGGSDAATNFDDVLQGV